MTGLTSTNTDSVAVTAPTPGVATYYPLPFDNSYEATPVAAAWTRLRRGAHQRHHALDLDHPLRGHRRRAALFNGARASKTISIVGQGESNSIVNAEGTSRVFEIIRDSV